MKIRIDKAVAEFIPQNGAETAELEALWIKMGNCIGGNKTLSPMGVYIPTEKNVAKFHIEGLTPEEAAAIPEVRAPYDTQVYCVVCNKTQFIKAGEVIPFCCDRMMELLD